MRKLFTLSVFLCSAIFAQAQFTPIEPDSSKPSVQWVQEYRARIDSIIFARTYNPTNGNAGVDEGKSTWNRLCANLYKAQKTGNITLYTNLISGTGTTGGSLLRSRWAGSFCGPFSTVGYVHYYMQHKAALPQWQLDTVRNNLYNNKTFPMRCQPGIGWDFLSKPDGFMDPTGTDPATPNYNPNGSEFNSENYHWMTRVAGYLFAQDFADSRLSTYQTWLKNLTRAHYNAGRVEWNSNNYWGHTINPLFVLHTHVTDIEDKRRAKAILDWNTTELALHYFDGLYVSGADSRAKTNAYKNFAGSTPLFAYAMFANDATPPTYGKAYKLTSGPSFDEIAGYIHDSKYVPSTQIVEIAQKSFRLPTEIRSAKPFYRLDYGGYADWAGNTANSSRNEFETLYLHDDYTLSSCATNRPDGKLGVFSEQGLWRLGIKTTAGVVQLMGNSGGMNTMAGRNPNEQIAQHRNVIIRTFKNSDSVWVGLPQAATIDWVGDTAFLDYDKVYVMLKPFNSTGRSIMPMPGDAAYQRIMFNMNPTDFGAVIMEVGTLSEHGSFANFKALASQKSKAALDSADKLNYHSTLDNLLTVFHQATISYTLRAAQPNGNTLVSPAGTTPKFWINGTYCDYYQWQSYEVSHGEDIIRQDWGSGVMHLRTNGNGLRISVSPTDGNVVYEKYSAPQSFVNGIGKRTVALSGIKIYPNPNSGRELRVTGEILKNGGSLNIYDISGKVMHQATISAGDMVFDAMLPELKSGVYTVEFKGQSGTLSRERLVIKR